MSFKIKYDERMPCGRLIIKRNQKPVEVKLNVELPMAGHKSHLMLMITNYDSESQLIYVEKEEGQALVDYITAFFNLNQE